MRKVVFLIISASMLLCGCAKSHIESKDHTNVSYRKVLEDICNNYKFPQYEEPAYHIYNMHENEFAVYDVDNDNRDELIVKITSVGTADMAAFIYDHNDNGEITLQYSGSPFITFYENGTLKADSLHNQTKSDFYPFTMYSYNKADDTYDLCGTVYGLDKKYVDYVNNERVENGMTELLEYPQEYDKSNSGTVYYICPDWNSEGTIPCDLTEYEDKFEQFTEKAPPLNVPFMKITANNITSIKK